VTFAPPFASFATEPPALNSGSSGCADTTSTRSNFGALPLLAAERLLAVFFFFATDSD